MKPGDFAKHASGWDYLKAMTPVPWEAMEAAPGRRMAAMGSSVGKAGLQGIGGAVGGAGLGAFLGSMGGQLRAPSAGNVLNEFIDATSGASSSEMAAAWGMGPAAAHARKRKILQSLYSKGGPEMVMPGAWRNIGGAVGGAAGGLSGIISGRVDAIRAARAEREAMQRPLARLMAAAKKNPYLTAGGLGLGALGLGSYLGS